MEKTLIRGIALDDDICRITVTKVPDRPGIAFKLFSLLAKNNINIDTIIQNLNHDKKNDISFTVNKEDFDKTLEITKNFSKQFVISKKAYSPKELLKIGEFRLSKYIEESKALIEDKKVEKYITI